MSRVLGGVLADPTKTLPSLFNEGAVFGFQWIHDYPFALPSLLNALFLGISTIATILFLEEVRSTSIDVNPDIFTDTIPDLHE